MINDEGLIEFLVKKYQLGDDVRQELTNSAHYTFEVNKRVGIVRINIEITNADNTTFKREVIAPIT